MSPGARVFSSNGHTASPPTAKFFNNLLQIWRPPRANRGLPGPVRFGGSYNILVTSAMRLIECSSGSQWRVGLDGIGQIVLPT